MRRPAPAPISCANDVHLYISALLDSAAANLSAGGSSFPSVLSPGFTGFDDPSSFLTFNRAPAAKNDVYIAFRNFAASGSIDNSALDAASTALEGSFLSEDAGALDAGPAHDYSTNSGDAVNPLFEGQERGFDPVQNFPIPFNEVSARSGDLTQQCSSGT